MPTAYLENAWYLVAWSAEIGSDTLLGRTLLDQPIVMFRTSDGAAAAIRDMCPHRFAPLSMGKKVGDAVRCAYHGLEFDRAGACVRNPHGVNGHIPRAAHIRSYPVVERYEGVWVWMGDAARADASLIPNLEEELIAGEGRVVHRQYVHVEANYELMSDNIMDLSHIEYLHAGSLGTPAVGKGEIVVERDGDTVWCRRRIPNDVLTPGLAMFLGTPGEVVDRYLDAQWVAPCINKMDIYFTSLGSPKKSGLRMPGVHIFTPETAASTHYFLAGISQISDKPPVMPEGVKDPIREEDKPMLEAIQRRMKDRDFWSMKPLILTVDGAAVLSRRILQHMITTEEQARPSPVPSHADAGNAS
jgi:phenylpropionate dioxygenase-like ring-hydroxylating dioxygenase large terminal subunit